MKPRKKQITKFYTTSEMHKHDMAKSKSAAIEYYVFQNVNKIVRGSLIVPFQMDGKQQRIIDCTCCFSTRRRFKKINVDYWSLSPI